MPRVIFKCPYLKGGEKAAPHLRNYVRYMATREGAQRMTPEKQGQLATEKQQKLVEQIVRDFPLSRGMFEYEDYLRSPTSGNATEFISRAVEENADQIAKRENYVDYIASRPRAQRSGDHALFTSSDDPLVLAQVADAVANHPGNVWLPIISLRREDAARLGYDNAVQWKELITSFSNELAEAMKIPPDQFRWYAAFHDEGHHPHLHMVCYSADGTSGYLTKEGIARIKSGLAKEIFRQELTELYQEQTQRRAELTEEAENALRQLTQQMLEDTLVSSHIEHLMLELAQRLRQVSGKKQYGYLKAPLKSLTDEIVDELAKDARVARAYDLWYKLREEVLSTYRDELEPRLPLSQQKELKRIRNMVIQEAVRLGEVSAVFPPAEPELGATDESAGASSFPEPDSYGQEDDPGAVPSLEMDSPDQEDGAPAEPEDEQDPRDESGAPPTVVWSERYKQARSCLTGSDTQPQDFDMAFRLFLEEAHAGNALAMHDLGRMFADGLGRETDPEQAKYWYAKALEGFLAVEQKKSNRYVEYRIGKLYAAGLATEQDYLSAADWWMKAAEHGYQYAQYSLAGLYLRGQGVEQDSVQAYRLYQKAAARGFPYAAYELGKMYRDGVGCERNAESAAGYFRMAFRGFQSLERQSHDGKLQYRIGWMLLHGVGMEQDTAQARTWFESSARQGNLNAQCQLARSILAEPSADPEQLRATVTWLTKAAEAGLDSAQYTLGKLYRDGRGVEQDALLAAAWFQKAAGQSNDFAAYALGALLLTGEDGLRRDVPSAVRLLEQSADAGNQFAQYRLGKLLLEGKDVLKDAGEAVRLLTASAEQGNQYAQYALGQLYRMGQEIPQDREAAAYWFTLSAAQGNEYARYALEHLNDGPSVFACATRLLHHMGRIFRDEAPTKSARTIAFTDKKLRQRIREKKIAMGHRPDDHEEPGMRMQ